MLEKDCLVVKRNEIVPSTEIVSVTIGALLVKQIVSNEKIDWQGVDVICQIAIEQLKLSLRKYKPVHAIAHTKTAHRCLLFVGQVQHLQNLGEHVFASQHIVLDIHEIFKFQILKCVFSH